MIIARDEGRLEANRDWCWAGALLCFVLLLDGCAAVGERRALPGTEHGTPEARLPPSPRYELLWLRTHDGTLIAAEFCAAQDANGHPLSASEHCPTMIFFYARAMCLAQESTQKLADYFRRMGVNVLIPEFPGYGMSEGRPTEKGCYAAADALVVTDPNALSLPSHIEPEMVVGFGLTLGKLVLSGRIDEVVDTIKTNIRHI